MLLVWATFSIVLDIYMIWCYLLRAMMYFDCSWSLSSGSNLIEKIFCFIIENQRWWDLLWISSVHNLEVGFSLLLLGHCPMEDLLPVFWALVFKQPLKLFDVNFSHNSFISINIIMYFINVSLYHIIPHACHYMDLLKLTNNF